MMRRTIILFAVINYALSANILGITTVLSHSHHLWNEVLSLELVKNGHNVTLLSHDDMKKTVENYTIIYIDGIYEKIYTQEEYNLEDSLKTGNSFSAEWFWKYNDDLCKLDLAHNSLRMLLNYPKDYKFDLILWDPTSGDCLLPLIKRFGNPPVVLISPFGLQSHFADMMGHHIYNYVPYFGFTNMDVMNFWHRLANTFHLNYMVYLRRQHVERMRGLVQNVFGKNVEETDDVIRKVAVALVNSDPILDHPQPMPPNVISVGGLQVKPVKPLPKDVNTEGVEDYEAGGARREEEEHGEFWVGYWNKAGLRIKMRPGWIFIGPIRLIYRFGKTSSTYACT